MLCHYAVICAHSLDAVCSLQVKDMMAKRVDFLDEIPKMPDFVVALRPHTVWEKTPVKLFCTVQGNPRPIVKWSEYSHLTRVVLDWMSVCFLRQNEQNHILKMYNLSMKYYEVVNTHLLSALANDTIDLILHNENNARMCTYTRVRKKVEMYILTLY